jgi:CHAT domain-containing protein/tetratricopeptide (TPR) repeat protein
MRSAEDGNSEAEPSRRNALAIQARALDPARHAAAAYFRSPADLHYKGPYARAEGARLNRLGLLHFKRGDYAKAEPIHQRALAILEHALGPEHPDVATSLNNLALVYHAKGDYAVAESLYLRALAIVEKAFGPEDPTLHYALSNLAENYWATGDYDKAEPLNLRALAICEKALWPGDPNVAHMLTSVAHDCCAKGDYDKAESLNLRALAIFEKAMGPQHPETALCLDYLAALYEAKGDYAKAEPVYLRVLALTEKELGPGHPNLACSLCGIAGLWLTQGQLSKAFEALCRTTAIQDQNATIILTTGSDEQKRTYMATLRGTTDMVVSLHVQFAPDAEDTKRFALVTILRRKGRVLDAMTDSYRTLRNRFGPAERRLLDELRAVSGQYSTLVWRGPDEMPPERYHKLVRDLNIKRQEIENQLCIRSRDLQTELAPVTLERVQAAIPEGSALVELFLCEPHGRRAERRYVAYVLRHEGDITWADLGDAAPIDAAVDGLLRALARASADARPTHARPAARDLDVPPETPTDPRPTARNVDLLVMQPIRGLLGSTCHILLSPDGTLNLVPFAALVDESGRYLIERYTFTYLTSGRDLLRFATHQPSQQGPIVLAAPDYDAVVAASATQNEDRRRASADARGLRFHPLRHAAEEGRALGRKLGTQPLVGVAATKAAVKWLKGPAVLHIATHGFFLPNAPERPASRSWEQRRGDLRSFDAVAPHTIFTENPMLRSGLAMAGANRRDAKHDDGLFTALEVSQLDLTGTQLMVLSACETGVGEIHSGDGVYGLRRAMVIAGAETHVMSLWSVDDAATRELMEAYYDMLLEGWGRSQALREVQLAMLQDPKRAHPYYWASFIVSGNPAALYGAPWAGDLTAEKNLTISLAGSQYAFHGASGSVLRDDKMTKGFIKAFISWGSSGLHAPDRFLLGKDGDLRVRDRFVAVIQEYDGKTGAPLGVFVSDRGVGGFIGVTLGPTGDIYAGVLSVTPNRGF